MATVKIKRALIAEEEARMLRIIRAKNGLSRIQVSKEMRIAPATASKYVDRLVRDGFISNGVKLPSEGGRPSTPLKLNPNGGVFAGVSISGNYIRVVCMDFAENILSRHEEATGQNITVEKILNRIVILIKKMVEESSLALLAAGIAHPGMVSVEYGETVVWKHVKNLPHMPVTQMLSSALGVPVITETTTHSATFGELCFGLGRDVPNFVCLSAYTSVGAGIVSDNRVHGGHARRGGDIGSWMCPPELLKNSTPCESRRSELETGIPLERLLSVWGIVDRVRTAAESTGDVEFANYLLKEKFPGVIRFFLNGNNPLVEREIMVVATAVGWVSGYLVDLLNPDKVIFGGPLAALGIRFKEKAFKVMTQYLRERSDEPPLLELTEYPFYGAAIGAAAAALFAWVPSNGTFPQ